MRSSGDLTFGEPSEHTLNGVVRFEPEDGTHHFRYYCSCGLVGGKQVSEDNAKAGHARHRSESLSAEGGEGEVRRPRARHEGFRPLDFR